MGLQDEEKILEKLDPNFRKLSAAELSKLIQTSATAQELALFQRPYREKMPLCQRAEEFIKAGRLNQAVEILNHALSTGYFGNEYAYGLLGDVHLKKGETAKAVEMYRKSGSIDSAKKIKRVGKF
ncbi:MAG: hypothetical protein HY930_02775 [Euryarchaeota archaeon]|nr:hypothetical protein [Euryarchaeota archaeon]